jgi:hypothetical protein
VRLLAFLKFRKHNSFRDEVAESVPEFQEHVPIEKVATADHRRLPEIGISSGTVHQLTGLGKTYIWIVTRASPELTGRCET